MTSSDDNDQKRLLTSPEIDRICNSLKPVQSVHREIAQDCHQRMLTELRTELSTVQLRPSKLEAYREAICRSYYLSQIQPGESVGILAAQNVGEKMTQSTLNTFHTSGQAIAAVLTGVPRFKELLNATKRPSQVVTSIYFRNPPQSLEELRQVSSRLIQEVQLHHLILEAKEEYMHTTDESYITPEWYNAYSLCFNQRNIIDLNADRIGWSIILDPAAMFQFNLTTQQVASSLRDLCEYSIVVASPQALHTIHIWLYTDFMPNDILDTYEYIRPENRAYMYLRQHWVPLFKEHRICGIAGIEDIFPQKYHDGWHLQAIGTNLPDTLSVGSVNPRQTQSNHMWDIYTVFGIEAVRQFLVEEFTRVVCLDSYIHQRHITLLADTMTYTGQLSSVNRHGVHRHQFSPFSKSSFEESFENFLKAGLYGDTENTRSVSAAIMVGNLSSTGTGLSELMYDTNSIPVNW